MIWLRIISMVMLMFFLNCIYIQYFAKCTYVFLTNVFYNMITTDFQRVDLCSYPLDQITIDMVNDPSHSIHVE